MVFKRSLLKSPRRVILYYEDIRWLILSLNWYFLLHLYSMNKIYNHTWKLWFPAKPNAKKQILGPHIEKYIASGFCNCAERISFICSWMRRLIILDWIFEKHVLLIHTKKECSSAWLMIGIFVLVSYIIFFNACSY